MYPVLFLLDRIRFTQIWILAVIIFKECSDKLTLIVWALVTDTNELRTVPQDAALPILFVQEQTWMEGAKTTVVLTIP